MPVFCPGPGWEETFNSIAFFTTVACSSGETILMGSAMGIIHNLLKNSRQFSKED